MIKPIKYLLYDKLEKSAKFYFACTISLSVTLMVVAWYAYGLLKNNIQKNKDVARLEYKLQKWDKFEKEFIPETALPRIPEIEAIFLEGEK